MLLLLLSLFNQSNSSVDYKVLRADVVNSQNYQFPNKFVSELVPRFSKKPIILLEKLGDKIKETEVGEVVCLQYGKDGWLTAKANLNQPIPENYVMRASFKIEQYQLTSGCNFVVEKAEITKFILLSSLFASSFDQDKK
jgi:hypothetical protein